ncbi:septal ring lytic transglycosylase RlpA family protein [Nocardiopsis quinghaiensis]|uniref:septal ring lytic transglycosylase RlpA family protein n=1 Tax=Nocardiopsis quinghaiensis TaxID=464995 RepID=UPI0021E0AC6E|nr:septal ring lytic transglycosylase RlpA family protein [Nocardiopsis quinghaiensis]
MGTHQPQTPPDDDGTTRPDTPVGPRMAAKRSRRKRTLILASATTAVLLAAGTATAAVIATGTGPDTTTNATGVPEADPDPLATDDTTPQHGEDLRQQAEDAITSAIQNSSTEASTVLEEPEETEEPQDTGEPATDGDTPDSTGQGGTCEASYYGADFAGRQTANGDIFDPNAMTAAHLTLPFGTQVQVTNPDNGKSVTVRINDRGPHVAGRCLDLSTAAFDQIIGTGAGVGQVQWQVVG